MYRILPMLTEVIREERVHEFEREQGGGIYGKLKRKKKGGIVIEL